MASHCKAHIIVIGDSTVGKSSLIRMYERKTILPSYSYQGLDYICKIYSPPDGGKDMTVKIWDTAGQERFRTLTLSYYKQAHGVILCFDVTNQNSFDSLRMWLEQIKAHADAGIAKILVGNKIDLNDERVILEE